MLIKLQEEKGYLNIKAKDIKKMTITGDTVFGRIGIKRILIYTDSRIEYVARYQKKQDAEAELERFKDALTAGDEEFEFTTDDELVKKIDKAKDQFIEEKTQEIEEFKQKHEQRHKELFEEVEEQVEFDRALTKFFCYAATFLTYGAVIHLGVKYIKAPLPLAVTGILAGVIGAALVSYAKKQ